MFSLHSSTKISKEDRSISSLSSSSNRFYSCRSTQHHISRSAVPRPSPPPPPHPKTTSHKKQKRDGAETRIGLGKQMKVTHGDIFHVLSANQWQHIPQDIGNSHPLFGKVILGGGNKTAKKGWDIELDILPMDETKS